MRAGQHGGILGRALVGLYPRAWRSRYGPEMAALLVERPPSWRDAVDLMRGAADAHLHPRTASRGPGLAAVLAGAAWTVVAIGNLAEPVSPDWPGLLAWTLPPAAVGAAAGLVAALGLSLRLGDAPGRVARAAVLLVVLADLAWIVALTVAFIGGPYGAVTGAAGSIAAAATAILGVTLIRADVQPAGVLLMMVGVGLIVPPPAAWIVAAAAWTAVGLWSLADRATGSGRSAGTA